ncbi:MAG: chromosome segregation protein SMC [Clostridia bacterium]|nr:chromosome segregation protein SMC [Clostridia bacterium]
MRLKKLYLHGFKSFADKVEITFEHGVTGVVGPNGCGKSNIGDAIRWVLGEQSARQLRGSKMEDVIFGGTDKRRRLGYCEVTLTFENEDRALPTDYTEVSVTRRVFRTGDSEYLLNNTPCRLKDIVDLFRDTGTGRDGYSIIGQGRVDEILSQKADERRQVFEEAAGIVKYKTRKQDSEKRLENTQANLDRVSDIVQNLEERIEPLRLQSEDARKYLALRDELKGLELNAFLLRSERYTSRLAELEGTGADLKEDINQNESSRLALAQTREQTQTQLEQGESASAGLREALQELIKQVEAGEGSAGVLRERLSAYAKEKQRLSAEAEAARSGESGLDARIALLSGELSEKERELDALKTKSAETDTALAQGEQQLRLLEDAAEQAKEDVINAMNNLGDVRSEQARLFALSQAIDRQIKQLTSSYTEGQDDNTDLINAKQAAQSQYDEEKQRLDTLNADARRISEQTRLAGEEFESVTRDANALLADIQALSSRAKLLDEMQRDYEGYYLSVKQVLKEAERRGGAGVHGVVANIIHADARIEKAIETALGAALQNIVTDTEEDAHAMIDYLKEGRYGRATFLPVSAVRGRTLEAGERRVLNMRGCLGVASEMVTFDERYRGIAENLLGRTVIAENLTVGIPIHRAGNRAFRLVTLDGDVMNVGGSMTGGSTQSRMTSLLSREREIKETGEKLKDMNARLNASRTRLAGLSAKRAQLKFERQEAFDALHQQEIALTRAEAHLSRAAEELDSNTKRAERLKQEIENLRAQLAEINENEAALNRRKESGENASREKREEAARLQNEVNEARPGLDALRQAAADARVLVTAAEKDALSRRQELSRLSEQKGNTTRMLEAAEESLSVLTGKIAADTEALSQEEARLGIARASLESTRSEFEHTDAARISAQEKLKSVNEQLDLATKQAEELSERIHRLEMLEQRVRSEFDNLTARIWEDYQLTAEGAESFRSAEFKLSEGEKRINSIKSEIKALGSVNVAAMDEYREVSARYEELSAQKQDLERARDDLLGIIEELSKNMEKRFREQFDQLAVYFSQTFTELFGGGYARLSLEDPHDALNCGIEIVAQPPGKKLQLLSLLSGGERALTAIAILFAMLKLKPTPFCLLDEIEAALDDANIDNFAEYLKTYSSNTQFVVITHRKGTMARCDALYGVAMEEKGVSKLVSVKLAEAAE